MNPEQTRVLWRLPDGMDEMLPRQALALEELRRSIYDLHVTWGYQPVEPPFVEFLDSLLSGTGRDFERQTFKVTDPISGKTMGLRADMTPQVARIDAHHMDGSDIARLFYLGTVVRAHTDGIEKNRAPLQIGAEIYGHAGPQSDVEVIRLMLSVLQRAGIDEIHLDLGHAGIFRSVCDEIGLDEHDQAELFSLLQRKAVPDIQTFASSLGLSLETQQCLSKLCGLNGDASILADAPAQLKALTNSTMTAALNELREISDSLRAGLSDVNVHVDLAEVRGYQYHTGVVFAAYTPGAGSEIARGGRYDGIGESFGRSRPATGYSADLKLLMRLIGYDRIAEKLGPSSKQSLGSQRRGAILCPDHVCDELKKTVEQLRASGEVVVTDLTGMNQSFCDRAIRRKDGAWLVESL